MKRRQCLTWGWGLLGVGLSNTLLAQAWATDRAASAGKLAWRERGQLIVPRRLANWRGASVPCSASVPRCGSKLPMKIPICLNLH